MKLRADVCWCKESKTYIGSAHFGGELDTLGEVPHFKGRLYKTLAMVCVVGCRLRVEVEITSTGEWLWAEYDSMAVESETENFRLHVTGYHGNAGDAFNDDHNEKWQSNGMEFSTPDGDNDLFPTTHCASDSGWWFRKCSSSALNRTTNAFWYSTTGPTAARPVSASRMMLQCGDG